MTSKLYFIVYYSAGKTAIQAFALDLADEIFEVKIIL
jgi:hypothetical protein